MAYPEDQIGGGLIPGTPTDQQIERATALWQALHFILIAVHAVAAVQGIAALSYSSKYPAQRHSMYNVQLYRAA